MSLYPRPIPLTLRTLTVKLLFALLQWSGYTLGHSCHFKSGWPSLNLMCERRIAVIPHLVTLYSESSGCDEGLLFRGWE